MWTVAPFSDPFCYSVSIRRATMADLRQCSKEFLTDFIALYESFPCIWRVKSKEYSDRDKKAGAYEILANKFREIGVTANQETVVKKINSLRSVYRKDLAKINKSIRSGAGEDEIYKPSLWYFDLLHFLNDQETPRQSRNTMEENEDSQIDDPPEQVEEDGHETADGGRSEAVATPLSGASTSTTSRSHSPTRKRKAATNDDGTTDVMKLVGKKLESLQAEDAFQVFGKHVANKLRDVSTSQNNIVQKLISDVLFEVELGTLTRNFQIVNMASQRQDYFNLTNWHHQNMPQHLRMPNTHSSHVGQYHSFSQPMLRNYVPEQLTHPQEYETIGQTPTVSRIIPQEGEQDQQTHASQGLANSSAANYVSTFQPN
ncbi:hypothetical protein J6590_008785 [Homalodisca vitripennis]|nr:hypothetical protein J6590_008785 [Homalodisca vitripennis]